MHTGKLVFAQLMDHLPLHTFRRCVAKYPGRYPTLTFSHLDQLPAGKLDPGESPLECGRRELLEETGYKAGRWRFLATIHPCIGYSDESMSLFLAEELTLDAHDRDGDEFLEIFTLPLGEAMEWMDQGRISDAKTMIGLLWADRIMRGWKPLSEEID